jgi:hypothetical protein
MRAETTAATRSTSSSPIADLIGLAAERYGDEIAAIAGAVAVPIYPTDPPEECEYQDKA